MILVNPTAEDEDGSAALGQAFLQCRRQLSRILGVPWSPSSSTRARPDLWQIDAVHRKRLYEASKDSVESLDAIIKLVAQLPNMRVGSEVKARVIAALDELDSVSAPVIVLSHTFLMSHLPGSDRAVNFGPIGSSSRFAFGRLGFQGLL